MRLLVIAARADYRLLVKKHVEIEWPNVALVEHRLGEDRPLEAQFAAAGFDAVVIVGAPPTAAAEDLAAGLRAKPEFAPIVLLLPGRAGPPPSAAHIYGRKIDRDRLIRQSPPLPRTQADADPTARTANSSAPSVRNRENPAIVAYGRSAAAACARSISPSERAGTLVVLKVFNQVPDVSDRFVSRSFFAGTKSSRV